MCEIGFFAPEALTDSQFHKLSSFIHTNVGIKMPDEKRLMVQSRLTSRLKSLKMDNFDDYLKLAFSNTPEGNEEIALMINAVTTNLTNFFRENAHFEYLTNVVLPELAKKNEKKIELWSAGCSSGQEPYTLSIVMQEFMRKNPGKIEDYSILATDISSKVLDKAVDAVYPKTTQKNAIFCRNVLIYFDKATQKSVIRKLLQHLVPGGYLFLGHSETIFGMELPLKTVGPTIFKKE